VTARRDRRGAASVVAASLLVALLAGCASPKPKPAPLEEFAPRISGRAVWQASIGKIGFPLVVPVRDGRFIVADDGGTVLALDADTGREAWRADVGARLSAGVGSDGRTAAVVTREGELVAIESGTVKWRKSIGTRVTTPPLVAGERVFALGVDRSLHAFDALDGRRLWSTPRTGDPLTLSQAGVLLPVGDTLVAGQGPRLSGFDPLLGSLRWEVPLASPRGTNEVERLADLVAPVVRDGDTICARAFQAAVGCVNTTRTALGWARNFGGANGIGGDAQQIVAADAADRISVWRTATGEVVWSSEKFVHRGLSTPLLLGPTIVFGDAEGFVHWLSREDGSNMLRLPTDGSEVAAQPAVAGTTLLVVTRNGGLFAFRPN
jgi:outer membrane assembly lipoprotein YfgL